MRTIKWFSWHTVVLHQAKVCICLVKLEVRCNFGIAKLLLCSLFKSLEHLSLFWSKLIHMLWLLLLFTLNNGRHPMLCHPSQDITVLCLLIYFESLSDPSTINALVHYTLYLLISLWSLFSSDVKECSVNDLGNFFSGNDLTYLFMTIVS